MLDKYIIEFDKMVKTLFTKPISKRNHPDDGVAEAQLSDADCRHVIGLMRINHCGEVCAQGLYQGQALVASAKAYQDSLSHAAFEETEHLAWTSSRVNELGGHTSFLNPLFYFGSLVIGVGAGVIGDKWSLGFLAETENQVGNHLAKHLEQLPKHDIKSKLILEQMIVDEASHEQMANNYGAANLPGVIKDLMKITSKLMTSITYYV